MACRIEQPIFDGFTIEFESSNLHINVQDTFGNTISNAAVYINCNGIIINGSTDEEGCFLALVIPGVVCDLRITKECLFTYEQKIVLIDRADLASDSQNFVVKVVDGGGSPLSGAQVSVSSDIHSSAGTTDAAGIFKGENKDDFTNTIRVDKQGFEHYSAVINPFVKVECQETGFIVASVITLAHLNG